MAEKKKSSYERVSEDRKKLVEKLIEKMKEGKIPSETMWNILAIRPQNPASSVYYKGGNRLKLGYAAVENEYKDPRWLTFKQASALGYKIKKGEHGILCEKWIFTEKVKEKDNNGKEIEKERELEKPVVNYFIVFNAQQIDGIPSLELPGKSKSEMLNIAQDFADSSECKVKEVASESAYYSPSKDEIVMPLKEVFKSDEAYLKTLLHEMGHSTGHSTRLSRDLSGEYGSVKFAKEELTAELTSVFISGNLGIQLEGEHFNDHSNYLSSWIKALEDNPNELFSAAVLAEKAADRLQTNYENYLENSKDNTKNLEKESVPNEMDLKENSPVLSITIGSERLPTMANLYEKEDGNYTLKILSYDKDEKKYILTGEDEIKKGAKLGDIIVSKEELENMTIKEINVPNEKMEDFLKDITSTSIDNEKGKMLYKDILDIETPSGKTMQITIYENKNGSEQYHVDTSIHDPSNDKLEKESYKMNDGDKIPGQDIEVGKEFIKSQMFQGLTVQFHWSEDGKLQRTLEEETILEGKAAYDLIKYIKEKDNEKSYSRELDDNSGYYDKTKISISYISEYAAYDTGAIRIDIGDRELANSNTVIEAIRDRLMEHPEYLENINLAQLNEVKRDRGEPELTKDEVLQTANEFRESITNMYEALKKDEKMLQYLEKENISEYKYNQENSLYSTTVNSEYLAKEDKLVTFSITENTDGESPYLMNVLDRNNTLLAKYEIEEGSKMREFNVNIESLKEFNKDSPSSLDIINRIDEKIIKNNDYRIEISEKIQEGKYQTIERYVAKDKEQADEQFFYKSIEKHHDGKYRAEDKDYNIKITDISGKVTHKEILVGVSQEYENRTYDTWQKTLDENIKVPKDNSIDKKSNNEVSKSTPGKVKIKAKNLKYSKPNDNENEY